MTKVRSLLWHSTYKELHLGYLLIHLLHELNNKVHQLVLQHLLRVRICDQEGDIIALLQSISPARSYSPCGFQHLSTVCCISCILISAYLDSFSPQDEKCLCSLGQESRKFVYQDILYIIRLFYLDAHAHTVHRWLYQDLLVFISRYMERVEEDFRGACGFDFGDIVALGGLGGKIGEGEGCGQGGSHALEVRA